MRRQIIDQAIIDGDPTAFGKIAHLYRNWVSLQNGETLVNRYFGRPEVLSRDFYCWLVQQKSLPCGRLSRFTTLEGSDLLHS